MIESTINIKPLSINEAFKGRRFKTDKYILYENKLLLMLPKGELFLPPYSVYYEFGLSNILSDFDNPVKPLTDILQKKYNFNDRDIYQATIVKVKVKKGDDYIKFRIESIVDK